MIRTGDVSSRETSDMWQVYLYLANERQADEHHAASKRRTPGESRIRRWRTARRNGRVQSAVARAQ